METCSPFPELSSSPELPPFPGLLPFPLPPGLTLPVDVLTCFPPIVAVIPVPNVMELGAVAIVTPFTLMVACPIRPDPETLAAPFNVRLSTAAPSSRVIAEPSPDDETVNVPIVPSTNSSTGFPVS
ncbi:hypothetical protein D3C73_1074820 [compost metagenome]